MRDAIAVLLLSVTFEQRMICWDEMWPAADTQVNQQQPAGYIRQTWQLLKQEDSRVPHTVQLKLVPTLTLPDILDIADIYIFVGKQKYTEHKGWPGRNLWCLNGQRHLYRCTASLVTRCPNFYIFWGFTKKPIIIHSCKRARVEIYSGNCELLEHTHTHRHLLNDEGKWKLKYSLCRITTG